MIVISGALVAVAFVLLVIGLFTPELDFVYASIAVSGAAFVFLIIGIFQRRGEVAEGADGTAPAVALAGTAGDAVPSEGAVTAIITPSREAVPPVAASGTDAEALSGTVLVVADRPRYHAEGCRYLAGKDAEEVDVREARAEGFTPCGVCKPDAQLRTTGSRLDTDEDGQRVDDTPAPEPVEAVVAAPRRGSAAVKAPAKAAAKPAVKAPAKKAAPAAPATKAAPARKAPAPTKAAKAAASAASAAPAARKAGTVVVIPDRGKFHTAACRYVRGVAGAEELTKAQATRQGYDACGVCKP